MLTSCSVTSIGWERVHLSLDLLLSGQHRPTAEDQIDFFLADGERLLDVPATALGEGSYRLHINVTNFHNRRQVPDGSWSIRPYVNGKAQTMATYDLSDLEQLRQDSRTFIYGDNRVAYIVDFAISEDDEHPAFVMRTYQMFRRPTAGRDTPRTPLGRRFREGVLPRSRRIKMLNQWYRVTRRLDPPTGRRILFASDARASMEGNLLRIHDRMVERGLDTVWDLRYCFRSASETSPPRSTLSLVKLIATSDIVLIDDYFSILEVLHVAPETRIIQTWHAGSGFKSVGYSRFGNFGSPKLQNAHRKYTYAIAGSKHLVPVYAEAFGIEESAVIPTGLPRIDILLDDNRASSAREEFFAAYPNLRDKRILLFAPTFRGLGRETARYDYSRLDLPRLWETCGEESVVLFRMHHFVDEPVPIPPELSDRLLDFTSFPDTNDLLHVTDVLITDYSSIIYEFALLKRPMLFYAYDRDIYSATRGFHRDFDETAPGKVCDTFDDLLKAIRTEDYDTWKIARFLAENFDIIDTNSADRVIDQLILSDPQASRRARGEAASGDFTAGVRDMSEYPDRLEGEV